MKMVNVVAIILLAVFLILSGLIGLGGIAISPTVAMIISVLAVASGILLLLGLCKGNCCGSCCSKCHKDLEHK